MRRKKFGNPCAQVYLPEFGRQRYPETQREISLSAPVFFQPCFDPRVYYSLRLRSYAFGATVKSAYGCHKTSSFDDRLDRIIGIDDGNHKDAKCVIYCDALATYPGDRKSR